MSKKIHIVSFNVPYPADYGGVIDVFYRIKALCELGVEIHLHAFTYGRPESDELEKYCSSVKYYHRDVGIVSALGARPYIVQSRNNKDLLTDLAKDDAPILLEGLHCCSVLESLREAGKERRVFVRAHNVEHEYYSRLADVERNFFKKVYLNSDARKLRVYESILTKADVVFAVTEADADHFRKIGCEKVLLMPSSHHDDEVVSKTSSGCNNGYAIYHADLSVSENIKAVEYLSDVVFARCNCRFVVAGRNPSEALRYKLSLLPNVRLVANPDDEEMRILISDAQVQILVTSFSTGLKLKLLNSLYAGRHCLVNSMMVAGTRLGDVCTVADTAEDLLDSLLRLMNTPFTEEEIERRRSLLGSLYSNRANAAILLGEL
ncbi:MAG: glycosyltransferase family 1 protein [Bacteroidales bacterium]|nr:glycosyltransferase family 1 protein [Bacteroidales bacterium]